MRFLGIVFILSGLVLGTVAALGHWTHLGDYAGAPPRPWEKFNPDMADGIRSLDSLNASAQKHLSGKSSKRQKIDVLYRLVIDRFTHQDARHTFFGNWLLFLAGRIHPVFAHIWDPETMISKGYSLFCDQSSYLLLVMALRNGIRARHVGLNGHVVMEVWHDSDWHLYDPDLEVVPLDSNGEVLSVEKLALKPKLLDNYYGSHQATKIVGSREDDTYMSYPEGARFEWKSNVLVYFERLMEMLKFIFPLVLIAIGAGMARRKRH